ncbi:FAD:protein FMN transferase [Kitasatospora sp. NBC_01287]|uniref:FAD:protein FMN transferase n=1 Tax=Kitasatospora sp. NBC_01287 TaxID=2903573 RepID=UPI00225A27D6|nr:FAD:protein FMN transferase [Kitasatospora sp. NBC_01287]MCX4744753.1 FAD:protein FMN transferase [Kitasatospora sp. NBC_01287]
MSATTAGPGVTRFAALGTTAVLLVADPARTRAAREVLEDELAAIDLACSRFRPDSELSRANAAAGRTVTVGPLFAQAITTALRAAELTDGAVDPTVGRSLVSLGYDRTFASVRPEDVRPVAPVRPSGWRGVEWHPERRRLRLPPGTALDLGATAKALAADRAAGRAAAAAGCGVLVCLGGDLATAGSAPAEGWQVAIADDHAAPSSASGPVVAVRSGGLATSGTTVRTWLRAGRTLHHIVDPATGDVPAPFWRTVSVAAATCVDANTASTAAIVRGERALGWLRDTGLPARLVRVDGSVARLGGWPADPPSPHRPQGGPR